MIKWNGRLPICEIGLQPNYHWDDPTWLSQSQRSLSTSIDEWDNQTAWLLGCNWICVLDCSNQKSLTTSTYIVNLFEYNLIWCLSVQLCFQIRNRTLLRWCQLSLGVVEISSWPKNEALIHYEWGKFLSQRREKSKCRYTDCSKISTIGTKDWRIIRGPLIAVPVKRDQMSAFGQCTSKHTSLPQISSPLKLLTQALCPSLWNCSVWVPSRSLAAMIQFI